MEKVKYAIIAFWLSHCFFRRLGKRYPDFFKQMVADYTDSSLCRKIMIQRYVGDKPIAFETIAINLGVSVRRVFQLHKKFIDDFINP